MGADAGWVANARMYAVTPGVRDAWRALLGWAGQEAGVPVRYVDHAAPASLENLWARPDLALAFACGYPFASGRFAVRPVAAPIPSPPRYGGRAVYWTDLVVRSDRPARTLDEALGGRIGWTVEHSQSGFNAVRHHLLGRRSPARPRLFRESVGPLNTPRAVIDAVTAGRIDVGPIDSYVHDLLRLHDPDAVRDLRVIDRTFPTAIPLLVASDALDAEAVERLRAVLVAVRPDTPAVAEAMTSLLLAGFSAPDGTAYAELVRRADRADAAGYPRPA